MTAPDGVGDFERIRQLGEGQVARVWLAREPALRRLVAIKELRPELVGDAGVRGRFLREARSAAQIVHPNVASIYRVSTDRDVPSIVLEYVEGRTLADVIAAEGPLAPREVRRILAGVAAALTAAHARRIVHRDVRASNILVEAGTGRVVLTDFGLARILETGDAVDTRLTQPGEVLGDPDHISPEQLSGEPVTEAADVYSVGVLGYELLDGRGPYDESASPAARVRAQLMGEPRRLEAVEAADAALALLLRRCLAKKPEQRPRAADLVEALTGSPARAGASGASGLQVFLAELRRRKVYRVGVAYSAAGLVALEVADTLLDNLPVPELTQAVVVAAIVAGFPVVLVLAWMYDITARGVERAAAADPSETPAGRVRLIAFQVVGLSLSLILAALIGWWILSP